MMKNRKSKNLLLTILIGLLFALYFFFNNNEQKTKENNAPSIINTENIHYSRHAKCRMDCRNIDEYEVKEILNRGTINHSKSRTDHRGSTYAYEGRTRDNQNVRIIVAPKDDSVTIVTVIDLDNDWKCDCN